ncbi:hypothetical protein EKO04_011396 [Ascochyta lentis]|uniref:Uncharacterized protein n=1 Tax=Ascochyta lentis TaxID=205686 RepID=A0A8H7IS58_9PLEO|nr:hypothetical protein EKO04_011396 [Ascochyta lentis]
MLSLLYLFETSSRAFGNAPHLFLSVISHYLASESVARMPLQASGQGGIGHGVSSKKSSCEPDPEPPAAPPIIILSENSSKSGSQPQARDPVPVPPHSHTSFTRTPSPTPENKPIAKTPTFVSSNPKPEPEPHPAPPVIILSQTEQPTSAYPSAPSPFSPSSRTLTSRPIDGTCQATALYSSSNYHKMGSKASKLAPQNGKLQSSQDKKDKDEMKEPTNYYTHRSKSMRRKAGKEANSDGAGGTAGGSAGGAGGMA